MNWLFLEKYLWFKDTFLRLINLIETGEMLPFKYILLKEYAVIIIKLIIIDNKNQIVLLWIKAFETNNFND